VSDRPPEDTREFLSEVSHELRTPLATLRGVAATLVDDKEMEEEDRRDFLAIVDREAERVGHLVEDLLVLMRLDAGDRPTPGSLVDLQAHVEAVGHNVVPRAGALGVRVALDAGTSPLFVDADPGMLEQALYNALGFGVDRAPTGGRVDVALRRVATRAELTVDVPGVTLSEDARQAALHHVGRARRGGVRRGAGGLGLPIVARVAEVHGWTFTLAATAQGARITLAIPLAQVA